MARGAAMMSAIAVASLLGPNAWADSVIVRLATWNVEKVGDPFYDGDPGDEDVQEEAQYEAAIAVLTRVDADVVAISEVSSDTDVSGLYSLAAALGYPFVVVPTNADNQGDSGAPIVVGYSSDRNAILSRFPIQIGMFHSPQALSGDPDALDMTRLVVEAQVDVPGSSRDLALFTQHFKSGESAADRFRRAIEGHRVGQALATHDAATEAVALVGDFNQELGDAPLPLVYTSVPNVSFPSLFSLGSDIAALISGPGLPSDVFGAAVATLTPLDAFQLDGNDATRLASGRRIDYILVSPLLFGIAPPHTEVYNSLLDTTNASGRPKAGAPLASTVSMEASDHLLVFVDLTFPLDIPCANADDCDDGNPCTAGSCAGGLCAQAPAPGGPTDLCGNDQDDNCDGRSDEDCYCVSRFDVDSSGAVGITDVQCTILLALWDLGGQTQPIPTCAADPAVRADTTCDGTFTISDVQLVVGQALGLAIDPSLDKNGNVCVDACDTNSPIVCGDGLKDVGEHCDDGELNGSAPWLCRADCTAPTCGDGIIDAAILGGSRVGEQCDDGNTTPLDGCSATCTFETIPGIGGGIIITEIFSAPLAPTDPVLGEWIELYNATASAVDLYGFTLRDEGIDLHVIGASIVVPPGEYVTLGQTEDPSLNGSIVVDYAYDAFFLSNADDEVILQVGTTLLDRVAYDDGATFPDAAGASMSLDASGRTAATNDLGPYWCAVSPPTPGAPNPECASICGNGIVEPGEGCDDGGYVGGDGCGPQCIAEATAPGPGELMITEIMQNPAIVFDAAGEWFEIKNISAHAIDVLGLVLQDNVDTFVVTASHLILPGDHTVFGINGDPTTNGGTPVDIVYTKLQLSNASDVLRLTYGGVLIDEVAWDDGATYPDPNGASMSLHPSVSSPSDNDLGSQWCPATTPYGMGDKGTPGAPNPPCP